MDSTRRHVRRLHVGEDRAPGAAGPLLTRRAFLRGASLLAGGALAPSFIAACGGSGGEKAVPLVVDPSRPWWLQNNFDPVFDELDESALRVRGAIPPELDGLYVRNGSNAQRADNPHWFLGDGMLHGVRLQGGRALWYRNRYVDTPLWENDIGSSVAGIPSGGNNQSNVSPIFHAGRLLTSGEVGFPSRGAAQRAADRDLAAHRRASRGACMSSWRGA